MKGILFKPQLIPLVLSGKKTMGRMASPYALCKKGCCIQEIKPRYHPGEIVYVKEAWAYSIIESPGYVAQGIIYKSDLSERAIEAAEWSGEIHLRDDNLVFRPAKTMPEWASRCKLKILSVRVERLQEITEEDARKEGVEMSESVSLKDGSPCYTLPFRLLWESIYGVDNPKAWSSNPWVFAYEWEVKDVR